MKQAVEQLNPQPDTLLIDYLKLQGCPPPPEGIPHGDGFVLFDCLCLIVAKVYRDRLMNELDVCIRLMDYVNTRVHGLPSIFPALIISAPAPSTAAPSSR